MDRDSQSSMGRDSMSTPRIGSMIWEGNYSVQGDTDFRYGKRLKYFEYNFWAPWDEKIVVFSDLAIPNAGEPKFAEVPYRVAWLMESPSIFATWGHQMGALNWLLAHLDLFAAVATCDDSLIEKYPTKMKFVPFGGVIVSPEATKVYPKTKLCSMTTGWNFPPRDQIYNAYKDTLVDCLGKGCGKPLAWIEDGFKDYMYHISVSSCCQNRFFSSNLTDPIACGAVPIWWGCSRIDEFFDMDGIITFKTMEELDGILRCIGPNDYQRRLPAIQNNLQLVEKYRTPDNMLWENVLSELHGRI